MRSPWKTSTAWIALLLIISGPLSNRAVGQLTGIQSDGWHTWQVPAVAAVPDLCCYSWRSGNITNRRCDLDGRKGAFGGTGESDGGDEHVQIYVLMQGSSIEKIRALSSDCPVTASSTIADIGLIDADDSVQWLQPFVSSNRKISAGTIAAIAVHAGSRARDILIDKATHAINRDHREAAIFWMAQTRVYETAGVLKSFIYEDLDPDIREHAAFAYSQSGATDVSDVLIKQGRTDSDPKVRSQAWFWLAESEADESEAVIRYALLNDEDEDVREEAVFALSQLPEERAMRALIQVIEDQEMAMAMRERALFWLARAEFADAYAYIDSVLGNH